MCKFENDSAPGFDLVAEAIQRYADEAPDSIKGRWGTELEERTIQKKAAAEELVPGTYSRSSGSLFAISDEHRQRERHTPDRFHEQF